MEKTETTQKKTYAEKDLSKIREFLIKILRDGPMKLKAGDSYSIRKDLKFLVFTLKIFKNDVTGTCLSMIESEIKKIIPGSDLTFKQEGTKTLIIKVSEHWADEFLSKELDVLPKNDTTKEINLDEIIRSENSPWKFMDDLIDFLESETGLSGTDFSHELLNEKERAWVSIRLKKLDVKKRTKIFAALKGHPEYSQGLDSRENMRFKVYVCKDNNNFEIDEKMGTEIDIPKELNDFAVGILRDVIINTPGDSGDIKLELQIDCFVIKVPSKTLRGYVETHLRENLPKEVEIILNDKEGFMISYPPEKTSAGYQLPDEYQNKKDEIINLLNAFFRNLGLLIKELSELSCSEYFVLSVPKNFREKITEILNRDSKNRFDFSSEGNLIFFYAEKDQNLGKKVGHNNSEVDIDLFEKEHENIKNYLEKEGFVLQAGGRGVKKEGNYFISHAGTLRKKGFVELRAITVDVLNSIIAKMNEYINNNEKKDLIKTPVVNEAKLTVTIKYSSKFFGITDEWIDKKPEKKPAVEKEKTPRENRQPKVPADPIVAEHEKIIYELISKNFSRKVYGKHPIDGVFFPNRAKYFAQTGIMKIDVLNQDFRTLEGMSEIIRDLYPGNNLVKIGTDRDKFTISVTFDPIFFGLEKWPKSIIVKGPKKKKEKKEKVIPEKKKKTSRKDKEDSSASFNEGMITKAKESAAFLWNLYGVSHIENFAQLLRKEGADFANTEEGRMYFDLFLKPLMKK